VGNGSLDATILAEALGRAGQVTEGLAAIDEGLERSERTAGRCAIAEVLRINGELLVLRGGHGAKVASEARFLQALNWARRQGAASWELRAATSLARLSWGERLVTEGRQLLASVYDQFTQGFETADLRAATALIENLRESRKLPLFGRLIKGQLSW
jgi:predicted ATPase